MLLVPHDDIAGLAGILMRPKIFNEPYPHGQPFLLTVAHVVEQLNSTSFKGYGQPLPASVEDVSANILSPGKLHVL